MHLILFLTCSELLLMASKLNFTFKIGGMLL